MVGITIKSFSKRRYKQYHQDFDKLIAQYFEEIHTRGIQNLIIDLRGNEGGNNPEKLYSYIARENDKSTEESGNLISQAKNPFRGNVLVLTNERSISAQETFVSIFKNNNRGLTLGQPTSGSYDGLCGGNKRKVLMPNSRFEIRIPLHASLRTYVSASNYNKGEGFPPDIKVSENINDFLSGKDLALELALDKIKSGLTERR
jgi:C-terminal processing protease CtpA/Prc